MRIEVCTRTAQSIRERILVIPKKTGREWNHQLDRRKY